MVNVEKRIEFALQLLIVFPDLNACDKWRKKMQSIQVKMPGTTFKIFKAMEKKANEDERKSGLDLGDLLGRGMPVKHK